MIDTTNSETIKETCRAYQDSRRSTYEFRCLRYDAVIDAMIEMGLEPFDHVLDVGCGRGEMETRLKERGFNGCLWEGIDGSIDGVNLNTWTPDERYDFIIAIEFLEHIHNPFMHLMMYRLFANKGVVITTPNPRTVDVLACDPTHVSVVTPDLLEFAKYEHSEVSLFAKPADSLLGWYAK